MSKTIEMETSAGTMHIELDDEKAPLSAQNFLDYVRKGHYDGTVFHRVIKGFMVQGGGFDADMKQKPTAAADPERSQQRPEEQALHAGDGAHLGAALATAQFFINTVDNGFLDFTRRIGAGLGLRGLRPVVEGTEVVDAIEKVRTGSKGGHADVPLEDVTIVRAVEIG